MRSSNVTHLWNCFGKRISPVHTSCECKANVDVTNSQRITRSSCPLHLRMSLLKEGRDVPFTSNSLRICIRRKYEPGFNVLLEIKKTFLSIEHWTPSVIIVIDQSSHMVYLNKCTQKTNLWKSELNWSAKFRENNIGRENTLVALICVFSDAWFRDITREVSKSIQLFQWKITSFPKLRLAYFRGSRYSKCFILSTALHCSLPSSKFLF